MTKSERVFTALMEGKDFNRFEAEKLLHDHCLPSTVSSLEHKYHITISRIHETVRGYMGSPTRVCRYWIDTEERERIVSSRTWRQKRKEAADPTDQDKESGSNYCRTNPTDELGRRQISPALVN
ncbi:hypothetical protein [Cycloclasticus pugetii]|uniref:hypothetical protein n=1 Tax=Cycloclasticus pugetii TaxID=34068 RepID=UPI003A8DF33E